MRVATREDPHDGFAPARPIEPTPETECEPVCARNEPISGGGVGKFRTLENRNPGLLPQLCGKIGI